MLKIAEKDKDFVYIYSKNPEEIRKIMRSKLFDISLTVTYDGCPAIVVKKQKNKVWLDNLTRF